MRSGTGLLWCSLFSAGLLASEARAASCDICDATHACTGAEVCVSGIPETAAGTGRCLTPCPNPGGSFGGCGADYTCIPLLDGRNVCHPRSDDCTNLSGYTPTAPAQACTTNSCPSGYMCTGYCVQYCTGNGDQGTCSSGLICGDFVGTDVGACGPPLSEGVPCANPYNSCIDGTCVDTGNGSGPTCLAHCQNGACGAGQTCQTLNFSNGATVQACTPPIVRTDGGVASDAGFFFPDATPPDAGFFFPDANEIPDFGFADLGVEPVPDSGFVFPDSGNPGADSGNPGADSGNPGADASGPGADSGNTGVDAADPGVDAGSGRDAGGGGGRTGGGSSVRRSGGGCAAVGEGDEATVWALAPGVILLGLYGLIRRRRG